MEDRSWEKILNKPLTSNEGQVIVLRFCDRMSYSAIGRKISLSANRIKAIEQHALRKINYQAFEANLSEKVLTLVKAALEKMND